MPYKDPNKNRAYQRKWAKANPQNRQNKGRRILIWYEKYKRSLSCKRCSYSFKNFPSVCEFHHTNDMLKNKSVNKLATSVRSWRQLRNELSITIPLCANCHREVHACVK